MMTILMEQAGPMLADLAKRVENGETIVVVRDGKPVLDLVPHRPDATQRSTGMNWDAAYAYLRANGRGDPFPFVADDFDESLPEDFLLQPLP